MRLPLRFMLLFIAIMLLGSSARAGSITEEQAREKARNFLQTRCSMPSGRRLAPSVMPRELHSTSISERSLYVFNVGDQDGFIIVAGDDRARPILGYADSGTFDGSRMPAALNEMLAIYARQIEMLGQTKAKSDSVSRQVRASRRTSGVMSDVAPLLTTTWDQGSPYNNYCPTLNDQTALTGCVATAMAQIAYYHKFPTSQVPSLAAYTSATNKINVSAWGATTFDWDNMLNSYSGSETNAQKAAVATLMRYCGQAAQMDYGFTSGAYNGDALYAFKEKLGYNANATFKSAASYSANGWEDLIYKEVRDGRPVYYSALNGDDGGPQCGGHAFVIDGYKADGNYFHVNWGWGGACNGYFNLFALDSSAPESAPTATGWHYQMLAIIGLSPEEVNTAKLMKDASGSWLITSADDWNELSANLEAYNSGSFKLTADISVTTMVGIEESQPFSGTFDGQGHTLNVNIESGDEYAAPFHYASNCTFKNLMVAGTITVTEHFAGGFIGWANDVTLQGCESKVTINSNYDGDGTHGGFISVVRGGTARFYDCVFSGTIKGENTYCCGGFCGWREGGVEIYNCLNIGSLELNLLGCATFSRNGAEPVNSYFISSLAVENQGISATPDQLADGSIARALQAGSRDWTTGLVWGQLLGTDATPVLTSDTNKGVYKVSFSVGGQVLKTVFTNGTIGDKMPNGEDFGLKNATFTCNGSTFTSTTPITSDITVTVTGTAAYTLTLGTPTNGSISINNTTCMPGILKKITAIPANGYVVNAITVTDATGKALPVTPVSNNANEFVFAFPKSSVTVNAEFTAGEAESVRFINGGMTLSSGEQPWTADTWTIWCDAYGGDQDYVGTPPIDALGHQWYEEGYALTNSDDDVLPNGNKVVWQNHSAFFGSGGNYEYLGDNGASEDRACNFYFRRVFTYDTETVPTKLYLWFRYDDGPASFYLNGTLIYANASRDCIDTSLELTPEQMALIHTDGTPNVLAAYCTQIGGPYYIDCGLYDPTALSYEVTSENTVRVLRNEFITGDVVIPETVTHNGVTYTVTELPEDVTSYCSYMTSMSIPRTITSLSTNVFWDLPSLQYVKSYIPVYQVYDKKVLVAAPIEATEFEVDEDCSNIWNNAFKFTEQLTTLTLPRSLTYIGNYAFVGCTALTEIYAYSRPVPQTEGNAFEGLDKSKITVHVYASALNSYKESWGEEFNYVTIPDPQLISLTINVTDRGTLRTLIEAAVAEKGSSIYDVSGITVTGNINQDDLWMLSQMCTGVYSLATIDLSGANIEDNYIGNERFQDREKLTSIILPETLEYIDESTFRNCDGLTTIDIPATVKRIWSWAFADCDNLTTVTGLEGLSEENCWEAWDVFGGSPITHPVYGGKVFLYMPSAMTGEYEMPAGITMTAAGSIRNSHLSSITLPASLAILGDDTFQDCPNLTDIYCYATTPPYCHSGVWENGFDRSACTVHVPASAVEDYQGDNGGEWREMGRIVGIVTGDLVDLTINVGTAGTLNETLFNAAVANANISDKVLIRNLTVKGNLNADDIVYLNTLPNTLYNMVMLDLSGATLEGNAVTERMFAGTLYKAIKLPTAITSIANEAFRDSRRLNSITLPTTLTTIGSSAFASTGLTSITIPDGVTEMGDRGIQSCSALTNILLGNGLTSVPECWAEFCDNLEEVTIGEKVSSLGWRAFRGSKIKHVYCYAKIPLSWNDSFYDGINENAVLHVYSNSVNRYQNAGGWNEFPTIVGDLGTYTTYDLTVNVSEMGGFSDALATAMTTAGCEEMIDISKLTVTGYLNTGDLEYLRDNLGATLETLDLSGVTMEDNKIASWTLSGCAFKTVELPANLIRIERYAFPRSEMTSITIPESVTELGDRALQDCYSLVSITVGDKLPGIPERLAEGCDNLEEVTLGKRVSAIDRAAFRGTKIKHVYCYAKMPPVWNREEPSFYNGINPNAVLHVYSNRVEQYQNAYGWKDFPTIVGDLGVCPSVELNVNVTEMGTFSEALATAITTAGCEDIWNIGKLTVTGSLNRDDLYYLRDNVGRTLDVLDLSAVTMEGNYFDSYQLSDCAFEELTLPANLERLGGERVLQGCVNLKSLHIPSSIRFIGHAMLNGDTALETVTGGDGVTEMDGDGFFDGCPNLKSAVVMGNIFFRLPLNYEGDYEVPANMTVIAASAFKDCSGLTGITLPTALKSIGAYAFSGTALTAVTLPETLESIGSWAFAYTGLTSITIPESVTWMGDRCFSYCGSLKKITMSNMLAEVPECWTEFCDKLEEVTIGKRVSRIYWRAFRGANIKHVYCYAKNPPVWNNSDSFYDGINSQGVLHVHSNCLESYQNAEGWKDFRNIVGDLGEYVTYDIAVNVPYYGGLSEALATAMTDAGCPDAIDISKLTVTGRINNDDLNYIRYNMGSSLEALDLSAVTVDGNVLGDGALAYCRFSEILLPNNIEVLQGWHVLQGCENLKTINIPRSVRYIGPNTLDGATALETVTGGDGVRELDPSNGQYFDNCPNLKSPVILGNILFRLPLGTMGSYEIPDYVTTIARDGMWNVSGLTALTLPESLTTIYANAFANDGNLKNIYYYAIELPDTDWAFEGFDRSNCTLHVYEEMVEVFQNSETWAPFNIVGDLGPMPIIVPMNEADFADLCNIYNTLGGNSWKNKWLTNKNAQSVSRWRGVTFDEDGYVTSIDLSGNRLSGDVGELTFTGLTKLTNLNLSNNAITGDIQPLVASLPNKCTMNVERQEFGDLGEHTLYEICRLSEGLPTIAFYNSESRTLASTLIGVGGYCQFYHGGTNGGEYWDSYIHADGGTRGYNKFYWSSPATIECVYPHHFTFTYKYEMGDANMDDVLNVLDLQTTLNASNGQEWGLFNFNAADTYGPDNDINVQDIVSTVNILLAQESQESNAPARTFRAASLNDGEACVSVENGQIVLYTTKPVAAIELRLAGIEPEYLKWNTEDMGFATATSAQTNGTHAIIYSMQLRQMEEGRTVLATFDASLRPHLMSAVLSDSKARSINVGHTVPTGISRMSGDVANQWSLTDLSGLRLATGSHATEAEIVKFAKSRKLQGVFILNMDDVKRKIVIK